jgi:geranylgeranyl reductase family protein
VSEQSSITHLESNLNTELKMGCDVIVVGAGPAGAAAAYYMAKAGLKVSVLEQKSFPRGKVCGDFVSPGTTKELRQLGVALSAVFKEANAINHATVYLNGEELVADVFPAVLDLPRYSRVMPRQVLDGLILETARKAGATVLLGVEVKSYTIERDGVAVTAQVGEETKVFHAQLLIGADGNDSIVAQTLHGAAWSTVERAFTARGYFEGVGGKQNEANMFYNSESFPGCAWIYPMGRGEANVGVGYIAGASPEPEKPDALLKRLIQTDAGMKSRLENAKLKGKIEVSQVNLYDAQAALVGDRVLLVGEAAGLTNPYNGEGVQLALQSGRWAAQTAAACNSNKDFSKQALSAYTKRIDEELGYGLALSATIFALVRNRNLNHIWLRWIELMGQKSKTDPQYARITSGVLAGMIFPNQQATAKALTGALQEATLQYGLNSLTEALNDPLKMPQATINLLETGFAAARYVVSDPFAALMWGLEAASKMAETATAVSKQTMRSFEKKQDSTQ